MRSMKWILPLFALCIVLADTQAGPLQRRRANHCQVQQQCYSQSSFQQSSSSCVGGNCNLSSTFSQTQTFQSSTISTSSGDALHEVNEARARRGLRPFMHDPMLSHAAAQCAEVRASRGIAGHTANDFQFLPPGANASAAGCGALDPSWGWGTCCTYDNHTYAGAAVVIGRDGKRYMHLFVR